MTTCTLTTKRALFVLVFSGENWSTIELLMSPKSHIQEVEAAFSMNPHLLIPGLLFFILLLCDLTLHGQVEADKITFLCWTLLPRAKNALTEPVLHKSRTPSFLLSVFLQLPQAHYIRNNFNIGYKFQIFPYIFINSTNINEVFTASGTKLIVWGYIGV